MIVWLASYPRSGNTLARIVLHHVYGVPTYTYTPAADDLSFDVGAGDLTGNRLLSEVDPEWRVPANRKRILRELDASGEVYFIKTHTTAGNEEDNPYRALLLVRHGQDALVSLAHYYIEVFNTWPRLWKNIRSFKLSKASPRSVVYMLGSTWATIFQRSARALGMKPMVFRLLVRQMIDGGYWTRFHRGWLERSNAKSSVARFEDMLRDPVETMALVLRDLDIHLEPKGSRIPTFEELQKVHPSFFRKGKTGAWKTEFPRGLHERFWTVNGKVMERLGYKKEPVSPA